MVTCILVNPMVPFYDHPIGIFFFKYPFYPLKLPPLLLQKMNWVENYLALTKMVFELSIKVEFAL